MGLPIRPVAVRDAYRWLFERLPGQHEASLAVLAGLIHGEPVLLIGPPGTGKTLLVTSLARMISGRAYTIMLHRYMTDVEVLGPYNIKALQEGRLVRNWTPIIDADIIFLDEVFNAPPFLLNALNSLLNERLIIDPFTGEVKPVKALAIFGASNNIPNSPELQAFADRFPVKVATNYVAPEYYQDAYNASIGLDEDPPVVDKNEVLKLRSGLAGIIEDSNFVREYLVLAQGLAGLREFGVQISDRTLFAKLPRIIASLMNLLECPPGQRGCTTYVGFLIMPWIVHGLKLPEDGKNFEALALARKDFMALMNGIKVFMRYECKRLAGVPYDLAGFENTIDDIAEVLRFQRWYSHLVDFLEWRLEFLRARA